MPPVFDLHAACAAIRLPRISDPSLRGSCAKKSWIEEQSDQSIGGELERSHQTSAIGANTFRRCADVVDDNE